MAKTSFENILEAFEEHLEKGNPSLDRWHPDVGKAVLKLMAALSMQGWHQPRVDGDLWEDFEAALLGEPTGKSLVEVGRLMQMLGQTGWGPLEKHDIKDQPAGTMFGKGNIETLFRAGLRGRNLSLKEYEGTPEERDLVDELMVALADNRWHPSGGGKQIDITALRRYLQGDIDIDEDLEDCRVRAFVSHVVGMFQDEGWRPPEKDAVKDQSVEDMINDAVNAERRQKRIRRLHELLHDVKTDMQAKMGMIQSYVIERKADEVKHTEVYLARVLVAMGRTREALHVMVDRVARAIALVDEVTS